MWTPFENLYSLFSIPFRQHASDALVIHVIDGVRSKPYHLELHEWLSRPHSNIQDLKIINKLNSSGYNPVKSAERKGSTTKLFCCLVKSKMARLFLNIKFDILAIKML